jgi:hypothetical protein
MARRHLLGLIVRVVAILLAVVAVTAAAAVAALHTGWGRERLRGVIEQRLDEAFAGDVRIGRVTGSVLGVVTLHGVEIDGPDGELAITAEVVRVDLALWPLVGKELRLYVVDADQVAITRVDGLLAPTDEPSGWDLVIESVAARGELALAGAGPDGEDLHLDALAIDAALSAPAGGATTVRGAVHGTWRQRRLPVAVEIELRAGEEEVVISAADVALGALTAAARDVRIVGDRIEGQAQIDVPPGALAPLVPDAPLRGPVTLTITARPAPAPGATTVWLDGVAAGAPVRGLLTVGPEARRIDGTIHARRLDLAALVTDAPSTRLDARVTVDLATDDGQDGIAAVRGVVAAHATGRYGQVRARQLDAWIAIDDGRADVTATGLGDGGATARLDAALVFGDATIEIERAHLVARADHVGRATGLPARGRVHADLHASGKLGGDRSDVAVRGRVRGTAVRHEATSARSVVATIDAAGLPGRPRGHAGVDVRGLIVDGRPAGRLIVDARSRPDGAIAVKTRSIPPTRPWRIDIDAVVRVGDTLQIALGEHRIRTHGVDWTGRGGRIDVTDDRIRVRAVRTSIAGGRLAVDGTYHRAGARQGDFAAAIHLDDVDLAEVDRSIDAPDQWRGVVAAQAHVRRRGRSWSGEIEGGASGIQLRDGGTPIDVEGVARLAPGRIVIDAHAEGARIGTVDVDLDVLAPRRLEDPAGWRRLDRRAIRRGVVVLRRVDLGELADAVGAPRAVIGVVDAELTMTDEDSDGRVHARGLWADGMPAPVDVDATFERSAEATLAMAITATMRDLATANVDATVRIPTRPFDVRAWRALDATAMRGAMIRIDDLRLDADRSRRLGLADPWHARGEVTITVAPAMARASASVDLVGVTGGPLAAAVDVHVHAAADADANRVQAWAARAGTRRGTGWTLDARGRVPVGLASLWDDPTALQDAPLSATITLDDAPVADLLEVVGRAGRVVGTVDGKAEIGGTLAAPTGEARVVIAGLGSRRAQIRELVADARWDGATAKVELRGDQVDGGSLRADAAVAPARLDRAAIAMTADRFDLHPLAQLAPRRWTGIAGVLDGKLTVTGLDPDRADVDARLRIDGARLPVGPQVGTMRDGVVSVRVADRRFKVSVKGAVGRGRLSARAEGTVRGVVPQRTELRIHTRNLTLIHEREPRLGGVVEATIVNTGGRWRITADVEDATLDVPKAAGRPLHPVGIPDDMVIVENGVPPPSSIDPRATWLALLGRRPTTPYLVARIRIGTTSVDTDELRGAVRGELAVTVGDDGIAVDGEIRAQEGTVVLFDNRYRIVRGDVRFDGTIDPVLDIELTHDFPEATLIVSLRGRASQPDLELSSRPATYTEGQLLTLMVGGNPGREPGGSVRDAAAGVAASVLTKQIVGRIDEYLPVEVDVLRFEAATAESGAAFTIGKWVSRRMFVAYRQRLEARTHENTGEAELEYWLTREVLLDATAGDRGHHDVDLLWINRW